MVRCEPRAGDTCLRVFSQRRGRVPGRGVPGALPGAARLRRSPRLLRQRQLPRSRSHEGRRTATRQRRFLLQKNMLGTCVGLSLSFRFCVTVHCRYLLPISYTMRTNRCVCYPIVAQNLVTSHSNRWHGLIISEIQTYDFMP